MTRRHIPLTIPAILALAVIIAAGLPGCRRAAESRPPAFPEERAGAAESRSRIEEGPGTGAALPDLRYDNTKTSIALIGPAGVLWRFHNSYKIDQPYFHPLNTLDGRTLTADRPADHPWHHGLWFSWKFINGVNFWEHDAATGRPAGRTFRNGEINILGGELTHMLIGLDYGPGEDDEYDPVLREERRIAVIAPDAEGTVTIDWYGKFTAVRDVVLDRTPLPGEPGGQIWGGYSGLSARLADGLAERIIMTSDGPVLEMPDDRYRGRHTAMDYSGLVDGEPAGIAIVDHPANPRSPTPWYVVRSEVMSFFTPAVLCYGPMSLRPGESFILRYRILVHPGRWDAARLRKEYERFPLTSEVEDKTRPFRKHSPVARAGTSLSR